MKVTYRPELVENNIELSVRHLKQFFKFGHGASAFKTKAVHDVSFDIKKGECFGLVGESGCGKTTTGRSLIRLYKITSGSIYFKGYRISAGSRWNEKEIKWTKIRGNQKIKELKELMKNELLYADLDEEMSKELLRLNDEIEKLSLEIKKAKLDYKEQLKFAKSEPELEIRREEVSKLKEGYCKKSKELKSNLSSLKKQKASILDEARKQKEEVPVEEPKVLSEEEKKEKYYDEMINSLPLFSKKADKDYVRDADDRYYEKLYGSLKIFKESPNAVRLAKSNKKVKELTPEEALEAKKAAIREKYESQIAEVKKHMEEVEAREKASIKQIKYDNAHVDKKLMSKMQMIFQDPVDSLDPRMTVEDIIQEGLHIQGQHNHFSNSRKVADVLERVGLIPEYASRYPHEFSGGQRQRIGIARALVMNPDFLICDEPISALDVSIRAQIINLLNDLKEEMGLTILFIAHDLSVVKYFCDRIAVMYFGEIVELATSDELFAHPLHPYTDALLSAIPKPDPNSEKVRKRHIYNPSKEHDYSKEKPTLQEILPGHFVLANSEEMEKYRKKIAQLDKAKK